MGRLLFISSFNTGHGHKSITAALTEQFAILDPSLQVEEADGFMLGGNISALMSKMYDKVAVHAPAFWKLYYELGNVFPEVADFYTEASMEKSFCRLLEKKRPDLIVSVHPCFVTPVINILRKKRLKIPVISLIADLDNVSRLWADKRSAYTICPTENARQSMLKFGIIDDKIKVTGFPVRSRFNLTEGLSSSIAGSGSCCAGAATSAAVTGSTASRGTCSLGTVSRYNIAAKEKISFLIMNGSQGLSQSKKMAETLLRNFNCNVVILAGNNSKVKSAVKASLQQYRDRLAVCGFVQNVEKYMLEADILILRASPNVMMEAVNLCKPFIITGSLTGQEEKNPEFAVSNNLGMVCTNLKNLSNVVNELLSSDCRKYNDILKHQMEYRNPDAARNTAEFILEVIRENSPWRQQ